MRFPWQQKGRLPSIYAGLAVTLRIAHIDYSRRTRYFKLNHYIKPGAVPRQSFEAQFGPSSAAAPAEFKRISVRGGAASFSGQGFGSALQIGTMIVLARLLLPSDYGLQSMVLSLTNFLFLFKDAGLSSAAVQREVLTHEQASTLFWINVGLGAALTILTAAMGPILVVFYKEPRLLWVTVASSSVFLFNGVASQHHALLDRSMRFATSAKIGIASASVGAAVAIIMAVRGYGYWALITQNIFIAIVDAAAVWIAMRWLPGRPQRSSGIRSMVRFGGTVSLNSIVVYFAYNTEKILLGRFWGAGALGIYGRAYQLANLPVQQLLAAVGTVAFPVLSRMQNDPERLRRSYLKFHSVFVAITIPVVISCLVFADEIVLVLFGPRWNGVAVVLRLLAPTVFVFAVINPLSWLLRATGQVARSLKIAFLIAPVVILGVVAGLHYGPPGVAVGYSGAMLLLAAPLVAWAKYRTVVSTADYLACINRPVAAGTLGGIAGWLFEVAFRSALAPIWLLIAGLLLSFAIYASVLLLVMGQKDLYVDLFKQLLHRNRPMAEDA
jgi:PST family polysaccharide transporter